MTSDGATRDNQMVSNQSATEAVNHAGVRFPPPFLYIIVFGLGMLLQRLAPLPAPPVLPARTAALLLAGAGVLLLISSNVLFRRYHTSLVPVVPSNALVTTGPYRLTRNPMYLGLLCVYSGVALWFGTVWALLFIPLIVVAIQALVIAKEERYLDQRFGEAYRTYRAQVRRWI